MVGEAQRDKELDVTELAAFTAIMSTILNLDEMITRNSASDPLDQHDRWLTRRQLFGRTALGIGTAALSSLSGANLGAATAESSVPAADWLRIARKARRVIYLFQSGGPSQMDLFDYKPKLKELNGQELPASVRMGQRLTGMTAGQTTFPIAASHLAFAQHGNAGAWLSELLPHTAKVADDLCFIKSMQTEAINHDPAITFFVTGSERAGRPSLGSWLSYGLGSENHDLPAFVVMVSLGTGRVNDQPLYDRLWGSGFLPTQHQGVRFRGSGEPVLISGFAGIDRRSAGGCWIIWPS